MRSTAGQIVLLGCVCVVVATGCPKPTTQPPEVDAGYIYVPPTTPPPDAGEDAGSDPDAGEPDAGEPDAGEPDAGEPDAGMPPPTVIVDLRADVNRNGVVEVDVASEDLDEETWDETHGAIVLANIDDDQKTCPYSTTMTDVNLAKCHDAADVVINGDDDLLDLSFLRTVPWPDAPDGASATVKSATPNARVRLFRSSGAGYVEHLPTVTFNAAELRAGLSLAIEGTDIVRDAALWDGYVDVVLTVTWSAGAAGTQTQSDTVRLRVAPVMTFHHLEKAETIYVANVGGDQDSTLFQAAISQVVAAAGTLNPLYKHLSNDQWTQDYFETGYMAKPVAGGQQHVIRVNYRSANVYQPQSQNSPLRKAGRIVFQLRGKDVAAVQQYDRFASQAMQSLNSFGNTETIPPYSLNGVDYPLGRLYRGKTSSFYPDPSFTKMIEGQKMQPPVYVDTEWLLVGHVDETISFLKANTPRGWIVLVNDVALAKQMLETEQTNGNGNVKMFVGQMWEPWFNQSPAEVTINQVLADPDVMNESAASALEVDAQLAILQAATGITNAEIVRVPFLHYPVDGYSLAYQPGTVNMLVLSDTVVAVPDPFGPVINGKDIFKDQLETALAPYGITVHWVDDWNLYHVNAGEVHCGTNAARSIPATKWWETGR